MCPLARGTHVTGRAGRRLLSGCPAPAGPGSAVAKAEDGPGVAGGAAGSAGRAVWGAPRPLCPAGRETASPRCAAGPPRRDSCTRGSVSASARQYVRRPVLRGSPRLGRAPLQRPQAEVPAAGSSSGLGLQPRAPAPSVQRGRVAFAGTPAPWPGRGATHMPVPRRRGRRGAAVPVNPSPRPFSSSRVTTQRAPPPGPVTAPRGRGVPLPGLPPGLSGRCRAVLVLLRVPSARLWRDCASWAAALCPGPLAGIPALPPARLPGRAPTSQRRPRRAPASGSGGAWVQSGAQSPLHGPGGPGAGVCREPRERAALAPGPSRPEPCRGWPPTCLSQFTGLPRAGGRLRVDLLWSAQFFVSSVGAHLAHTDSRGPRVHSAVRVA